MAITTSNSIKVKARPAPRIVGAGLSILRNERSQMYFIQLVIYALYHTSL
jgi:hypothetical protein